MKEKSNIMGQGKNKNNFQHSSVFLLEQSPSLHSNDFLSLVSVALFIMANVKKKENVLSGKTDAKSYLP
jgi:hypothetical protein